MLLTIPRTLVRRHLLRSLSTTSTDAPSQSAPTAAAVPRDDELFRYLKVKCTSHEPAILDSYEKFMRMAAEHLDLNYVRTEEPHRVIKRKTMLASRFVHKKYRVQYEHRSYFRHLIFKNMTGSTMDTFLEYIERNLPEGVLMEVEKHKLAELPFDLMGETPLESTETGIDQDSKPNSK